MTTTPVDPATHQPAPGLVDLAARRLGGLVVACNDEFFGSADHLLTAEAPTWDPTAYTSRGKLVDGWETRRRRDRGADWCIVRLGVPGVVDELVVDTANFTGNHPQELEVHATVSDATIPEDADWFPLVTTRPLRGDALQAFRVDDCRRATHVRLSIVPDGGVARLRVLGRPTVDLREVADPGGRLDLAAVVNGARVPATSDEFFAPATNLIMVGDSRNMGDGWETRRRRTPGHDWVVVELATTGVVERVELDTTHFLGNHPDHCIVEVAHAPGMDARQFVEDDWTTIVPAEPMRPHARHVLPVVDELPATHLRLVLVPDGGVARLRAFGRITDEGWRRGNARMLDALGTDEAHAVLLACCGSTQWVAGMLARRPLGEPERWLDAADEVWGGLDDDAHREAFAAHPRIGERSDSALSSREQATTADADPDVLARLREGNRTYEQRFGHVFLIRASGRSPEEMLAALEQRLGNDPAVELANAAEQQRQITRLRLSAWLDSGSHP